MTAVTRYQYTHPGAESYASSGKRIATKLLEHGVVRPGQTVLDFGAGWGRVTLALLQECPHLQVHAVDRNIKAVRYLQGFASDRLRVYWRSDPAVPGLICDVALCFYVLQHMHLGSALRKLRQMARMTRGPVLFTYPVSDMGKPEEYIRATVKEGDTGETTYDTSRYADREEVMSWMKPRRQITPAGFISAEAFAMR